MKIKSMILVVLGLFSLPLLSFAQQTRFSRSIPVAGEVVVTDNLTGLMWQGCAAGLQGEDCKGSSALIKTWVEALDFCQDSTWGNFTDWRLPNVNELSSLVDDQESDPSIDELIFPYPTLISDNYFWTATTCAAAAATASAWIVSFKTGIFLSAEKGENHSLRCVRSTP